MSVSPLSVSTFPIEGHLRRQAAARRQQEQVLHLAAECFGSGSPTAVDWLSAQGGARPSKWFGEIGWTTPAGRYAGVGCGAGLDPASAWKRVQEAGGSTRTQAKHTGPTTPLDHDPGTGETTGGRDDDWPGESGTRWPGGVTGSAGSCPQLDPPSDSEREPQSSAHCGRDSGCDELCTFDGSTSECSVCDERALYSVVDLDPSAARDTLNFRGDSDFDTEDLVLRAWRLLQLNTDLIEWAWCLVRGTDNSVSACVLEHLERTEHQVTINFKDTDGGDLVMAGYIGTSGGRITIFVGADAFFPQRYLATWKYGTEADKTCSVVDLACTIMHELAHVCGESHGIHIGDTWLSHGAKCCDRTYMAENVFRWAMFRRFGGA